MQHASCRAAVLPPDPHRLDSRAAHQVNEVLIHDTFEVAALTSIHADSSRADMRKFILFPANLARALCTIIVSYSGVVPRADASVEYVRKNQRCRTGCGFGPPRPMAVLNLGARVSIGYPRWRSRNPAKPDVKDSKDGRRATPFDTMITVIILIAGLGVIGRSQCSAHA
jgi:hypothetical protein